MVLIDTSWSWCQGKNQRVWLADDESKITADFDADSAVGSMIFVIATGNTWMKNTQGKWQKCGSTEVIA